MGASALGLQISGLANFRVRSYQGCLVSQGLGCSMGLGNRIVPSPEGGLIAFYKLTEWWERTYSIDERHRITETCDPSGETLLARGRIWESSGTAVQMLNGLASHFLTADDYPLAIRILEKAYAIGRAEGTVIDQHYTFEHLIQLFRAAAQIFPRVNGMKLATCQCQIDLAPRLASELVREGAVRLPRHSGYEMLIEARDLTAHFEDAIRLCRQARQERWSGDWDKTLKRLKRNLSRRQSAPSLIAQEYPEATHRRLCELLAEESRQASPVTSETDSDGLFREGGSFFSSLPPAFVRDFVPEAPLREVSLREATLRDAPVREPRESFSELDDARAQIARLERENGRLLLELTSAHQAGFEARDTAFLATAQFEDMKSQLNKALDAASDALDQVAAREQEIATLREAASAESQASELLRNEIANATKQHVLLRDRIDAMLRENESLRATAEGAAIANEALQARLAEAALAQADQANVHRKVCDERERLLRENADAARVIATHEQTINALRVELEIHSASVGSAESELIHLRRELESTISQRDAVIAARANLESELQALHSQLAADAAESARLRIELDDREEAFRQTLEEKVKAQAERARLALSLSELESESTRMKATIDEMHAELHEMHAEAAKRLADISDARSELDDLRRQLREREHLAEEVSRLGVEREATIETLEGEIDTIRRSYNESMRTREDLEAQLDESRAEIEGLHETIEESEIASAGLRAELGDSHERAMQEQARTEQARARAEQERDRAEQERVRVAEVLHATQAELQAFRQGMAQAQQHIMYLDQQCVAMRNELNAARPQFPAIPQLPGPQMNPPMGFDMSGQNDAMSIEGLRREVQALRAHVDQAVRARDGLLVQMRQVQATALNHAQSVTTPAAQPVRTGEPGSSILNPEWEYDPYARPPAGVASHIVCNCPHCHKDLRIPRQFAGWFGQCKLCGHDITVPKQ